MPKKLLFLIAAIFLQACSALLPTTPPPAPLVPPTITPTASRTPTATVSPTRTNTPLPRATATLIISEFNTPVVFASQAAAFPTSSIFESLDSLPLGPIGQFDALELTRHNIFYGTCKQNYTQIRVRVQNPEDIRHLYIFFRLESAKKPGDTTPWTGSVTDYDGGGYYDYLLWASNIPERRNFIRAWVHFQYVAEDAHQKVIGRSEIYTRELVLEPCK